jgi:hypothetical protein
MGRGSIPSTILYKFKLVKVISVREAICLSHTTSKLQLSNEETIEVRIEGYDSQRDLGGDKFGDVILVPEYKEGFVPLQDIESIIEIGEKEYTNETTKAYKDLGLTIN